MSTQSNTAKQNNPKTPQNTPKIAMHQGDYEFVDCSDFYPDDEELMDIDASVNVASGKYHE
jgi:hypothetical protein